MLLSNVLVKILIVNRYHFFPPFGPFAFLAA